MIRQKRQRERDKKKKGKRKTWASKIQRQTGRLEEDWNRTGDR